MRSGEAINTKPLVKLIKRAERQAPEIQAEIESDGPNRWSTAARSWVSEFEIKETAETKGNNPAVCRSAYICLDVLDSFEKGKVVERYFETVEELVNYRGRHLHQAERALLRLLKRKHNGNSCAVFCLDLKKI